MNSLNLQTDKLPVSAKQLKLATQWFDAMAPANAKKLVKKHSIFTYRDLIIAWTKEAK